MKKYKKKSLNLSKLKKILSESYAELKEIDSELDIKFSYDLILIGNKSIDSVSLLNFLLIIEKKLNKKFKINASILELDLFSSNKKTDINDLINIIIVKYDL